jgi:hypothetical protein
MIKIIALQLRMILTGGCDLQGITWKGYLKEKNYVSCYEFVICDFGHNYINSTRDTYAYYGGLVFIIYTSRMCEVLLRGNSTNAYIS